VGRIEAPLIDQYDSVIDAYAEGTLDGVSLINAEPTTISKLRAMYSQEFRFTKSLSTLYLAFCTDRPPLNDSRFRKALIHAIDRERLMSETRSVHYEPAFGGFLPPGIPGHSPNIGLGCDEEAARRYLAAILEENGDIPSFIELLYTGDPEGNPVASFLGRRWIEVLGLEVVIQGLPWGEFLDRIDHDPPHIAIMGWRADYPDPDNMLRVPFHSREGQNNICWHNVDFDFLTEEAAQITDRKKRIELYQAADRILVEEEAAIMPLGYAQGRQLIKPYVQIPRSPPALTRLKNASVIAGRK
jgi:ABC-type oligopeptide transport system substrate-binding subunit